jgi:Autotransporter beta-domain
MKKYFKLLCISLILASGSISMMAYGQVLSYTSQADFSAATTGTSAYSFSGFAFPVTVNSSPYTFGPLTFSSAGTLDGFNDGKFSGINYLGVFNNAMNISVGSLKAVGFNIGTDFGSSTVNVYINGNLVANVTTLGGTPSTSFIGFTSTSAITNIQFSAVLPYFEITSFLTGIFGPIGPSTANTQTSLTNNLASLQSPFNLQSSIINNGLNYDCSLFDVHGLCISTGGRYTNTNTPSGDSTSALVIGGYHVNDNVRVGAYLDQGVSSSTPTGINLKQHNPLFGAFAVWQARQDGLGAQVKVAAGYNDSDMTVTRALVGTSESGSGSTSLISQAVSLVGSYGVEMQGSWIASPYVGIRYTDVKAGGYTEASSSSVTAPLSYASLSQSTTSLLGGIRWSGKLSDRVGLNGSVGVEQDVSNNNSSYTATGVTGLTSIAFNTDINKSRPVASIGTTVSIDKRQQLAFSVFYSEQAFSKSSTTSAYGTYTIGF